MTMASTGSRRPPSLQDRSAKLLLSLVGNDHSIGFGTRNCTKDPISLAGVKKYTALAWLINDDVDNVVVPYWDKVLYREQWALRFVCVPASGKTQLEMRVSSEGDALIVGVTGKVPNNLCNGRASGENL